MKVAFLTHEPFFPPSGGGSAEAVYLVREFVERQHEVTVFCPTIAERQQVERDFGIKVVEFTKWKMGRYAKFRNFKYLLYPSALVHLVRSSGLKPDLLFSQHAISAVAAGRLKRQTGLPTVMNFLDYLTGFMEAWPQYIAPRPLLKVLEHYEISLPRKFAADALLTVSDTLADYAVKAGYPRERIRPIYYGFDAKLFPFRGAPARNAKPVIVVHGSLDQHHLRATALGAILRVHDEMPEALFKFVGHKTGPLQKLLNQLAQRKPGIPVQVTGFVPYSEVAGHLASADLGMVPYEESTGTHCAFVAKIVEYLAVGLPVVSTPLKSAMHYFKNEPRIRFSKFEGSAFGSDILAMLRDSSRQAASFAEAASRNVRENLDWKVISSRAVDFTEEARCQP